MTKITFYKSKECYVGFEVSGHAGNLPVGENPLCAAISVASQMIVVGIREELKLNPEVKMKSGYLKMIVSEKDISNEKVQLLMKMCYDTLLDISKNNKKYVRLEVKENV